MFPGPTNGIEVKAAESLMANCMFQLEVRTWWLEKNTRQVCVHTQNSVKRMEEKGLLPDHPLYRVLSHFPCPYLWGAHMFYSKKLKEKKKCFFHVYTSFSVLRTPLLPVSCYLLMLCNASLCSTLLGFSNLHPILLEYFGRLQTV